jgi:hypothetical protein
LKDRINNDVDMGSVPDKQKNTRDLRIGFLKALGDIIGV